MHITKLFLQKPKKRDDLMPLYYEPFVRYIAKTKYFIDDMVVARDCRIIYVLSGKGFVECNDKSYLLSKNTFVYFPSGVPYHIHSTENLTFYTVNFDFTQEFSHMGVMVPKKESIFDYDTILRYNIKISDVFTDVLYITNAKKIGNDLESIYNESKNTPKNQDVENLYMKIILLKLSNSAENNGNKSTLCEKIKEAVRNNITLNIRQISDELHHHPYYLNEVFKKSEGMTLHEYITRQRLIKVREMLLTTDISISEISHQCGFYSQSHMSNTFKAVYKITPGKMRKL